jgi:hypothetical protein
MKPKLKKSGKAPIEIVAEKASPARRTGPIVNTLYYGDNIVQASGRKSRQLDLFCWAGGAGVGYACQEERGWLDGANWSRTYVAGRAKIDRGANE